MSSLIKGLDLCEQFFFDIAKRSLRNAPGSKVFRRIGWLWFGRAWFWNDEVLPTICGDRGFTVSG